MLSTTPRCPSRRSSERSGDDRAPDRASIRDGAGRNARRCLSPRRPRASGGSPCPAVPSLSETVRLASKVATVLTLTCCLIAVVVHAAFRAPGSPVARVRFHRDPSATGRSGWHLPPQPSRARRRWRTAAGRPIRAVDREDRRAHAGFGDRAPSRRGSARRRGGGEPDRRRSELRRIRNSDARVRRCRTALSSSPPTRSRWPCTCKAARARSRARHMLAAVGLSVAMLALAAVLETYVNL